MIAFIFLPDFPTTGNRSFTFVQDDALTFPSLWRFPFPITSDALSSNRHSERRQECLVGKTGNGIVTQSNNSITPVTFYRKYRFYRMQGSPGIWKKTPTFVSVFSFISSFLSSRAASGQVLSAFVSLTSVFGMDTGDPHSYRHCFSESLFSQNHIEEVLKLFACLGVPKLRPRPISFMSLQALRLFHS